VRASIHVPAARGRAFGAGQVEWGCWRGSVSEAVDAARCAAAAQPATSPRLPTAVHLAAWLTVAPW
jgi:hypothetical protein